MFVLLHTAVDAALYLIDALFSSSRGLRKSVSHRPSELIRQRASYGCPSAEEIPRQLLVVAAAATSTYTCRPSGPKRFWRARISLTAAHLSSEFQHAMSFQYTLECASHIDTLRQFVFVSVFQSDLRIVAG